MLSNNTLIVAAIFLLLVPVGIIAQESTFSDPNVDYSFVLPEAEWKMISKPSATSPNVEYVYNDRREAHMEVRKLTVTKDTFMTDVMKGEESRLQFLPGYAAGKEENFAGNLRGNVFNYEFLRTGRNASGRFYFLRAADTTVYVLRFTGDRDRLKSIRNQTDSIARTFTVKGAKVSRF